MDEHIFQLIRDNESNDSFRISVEFKENNTFNVTVLQKLNAWIATVDKENIVRQARQFEINVDEYYKKIQEYFTIPTSVDLKFNNNELVINCKLENKMKIKYFSCKLKQADYNDCVEHLLEKFYVDRNNSLGRLTIVSKEKNELEKSKNYFESKLNEFIERKKTDDQELYSNFVLVLNEKKKRIQHLSELLEAFKRGRPTLNPHVEVKKHKKKTEEAPRKKIEIKEEISESDSNDDNYNTDEEKPKNLQDLSDEELGYDIGKSKRVMEPIPGTSKRDYDVFSDDSPPRHLLPKRIKSETIVNDNNVNKVSTSNQSSENIKDKKKVTSNTVDETPNVNFDTQDLLDNM